MMRNVVDIVITDARKRPIASVGSHVDE
jgi:hypothetical protein